MAEGFKLSSDVVLPAVSFGCAFGSWTGGSGYQGFLPEEAWKAVRDALEVGFTSFDTAYAYGTERHVGNQLGAAFASGKLKRSDVFITTKFAHPTSPPHLAISHLRTWNPLEVPDPAARLRDDMMLSLDSLGVGYVDLALLHWPGAFSTPPEDAGRARAARLAMWVELLALRDTGFARAVGVCNFTQAHLDALVADMAAARVPRSGRACEAPGRDMPSVNQIEVHPYCAQRELVAYCRAQGVVPQAYAPLASGAFSLLADPTIIAIAQALGRRAGHDVTPAQVVLRWALQGGCAVVPKSTNAGRMREALAAAALPPLTADEFAEINALEAKGGGARRTCPDPNPIV